MSKARLLLTGDSGYIGRILEPLLQTQYEVIGLSRHSQDLASCISEIGREERLKNLDFVFHLADARLQYLNFENWRANVKRHETFLEKLFALSPKAHLIFASSCSVYGRQRGLANEQTAPCPTSGYALSKLAIENLIRESGFSHSILRFGTAFGPSPVFRSDLFINELVLSLLLARPFEIFDPAAQRPFIFTYDFVRALQWSLRGQLEPNKIWNVAAFNADKKQIGEAALSMWSGSKPQWSHGSQTADSRDYAVSCEPFLKSGFQFEYGLKDGLTELIRCITPEARATLAQPTGL